MAYGADSPDPSTNFAGNKQYFHNDFYEIDSNGKHTPTGNNALSWFFQWAFSMATATIVSGGVAERINFPCYVTYCACMTAFIYPVVVYWTWSGNGWLYGSEDAITDVGYYDFAGSGIVHATGGVGALVSATILGPRKGRWTEPEEDFAPHNIPLCVLGTFFLWFGWYGFNCGSTLGLSSTAQGQLAAHVAMNTTIAAATGGITVLVLRFIMLRKYDVGGMCNGVLGGCAVHLKRVLVVKECLKSDRRFCFIFSNSICCPCYPANDSALAKTFCEPVLVEAILEQTVTLYKSQ